MKLLHFQSGNHEYIVLSDGDEPDEDFALSGYSLSTYEFDGEWPARLPINEIMEKQQ